MADGICACPYPDQTHSPSVHTLAHHPAHDHDFGGFDRTICYRCNGMHSYCTICGLPADLCDEPSEAGVERRLIDVLREAERAYGQHVMAAFAAHRPPEDRSRWYADAVLPVVTAAINDRLRAASEALARVEALAADYASARLGDRPDPIGQALRVAGQSILHALTPPTRAYQSDSPGEDAYTTGPFWHSTGSDDATD